MSPFLVAIIAVLVVGVLIFAAYVAHQEEKKRTAALSEFAKSIGLTFTAGDNRSEPVRLEAFELFRRGDTRRASNVMHGAVNTAIGPCGLVMADYRYTVTTSNGKNTSRHTTHTSYLALELPFHTPGMTFDKENLLTRFAGAIGFPDIRLESDEFNRLFRVTSPDRRFAFAMLDPRMMQHLLDRPDLNFQISASILLVQSDSGRWTPEQYRQRLARVLDLLSHWPNHHVLELIETSPAISARA